MRHLVRLSALLLAAVTGPQLVAQQPDPRLDALKKELISDIDSRAKFTQEMVDQIFSFGELGFQEFETVKYLVDLLRKEGFRVETGYAGIPTAFVAPGAAASRSLRWAPTSMASPRRPRNPGWPAAPPWFPARPVMARATTAVWRSTSPPPWP